MWIRGAPGRAASLGSSGLVGSTFRPSLIHMRAARAHEFLPPMFSCLVDARFVFRPSLARAVPFLVPAEVLANYSASRLRSFHCNLVRPESETHFHSAITGKIGSPVTIRQSRASRIRRLQCNVHCIKVATFSIRQRPAVYCARIPEIEFINLPGCRELQSNLQDSDEKACMSAGSRADISVYSGTFRAGSIPPRI
jgi:hypothetical protein